MVRRKQVQAVLLVVALSGCLTGCVNSAAVEIYKGEYFYNFENATFTPHGKDENWCLSGDMSKAELPAKGPSGPWGTADVEVSGTLGPVGRFGNLGGCSRVLTVEKVLEIANMKSRE
jgi:hypothetical protein